MIDAEHIYAVVRHASGRIDFEPLSSLICKNKADMDIGQPIKRCIIDVAQTTKAAQEIAKEIRLKLKKEEHEE